MVDIKRVGVIGAGQMGSGIAHVCALAGYEVLLNDLTREKIDAGLATVEHNLARQVHRGVIDQAAMDAALGRIKPAEDLDRVGKTDLAIEAATEDEDVKKAIFKALQPHLAAGTLLASNTSSISITRLASTTDRPERFIGLHFMVQLALPGDFCRITYFCVSDAARGSGVGRALEEAAEALARARGCDRIEVHCHQRRTDAHRFYYRQGYEESPKYLMKSCRP